jgi:hypothetical protein
MSSNNNHNEIKTHPEWLNNGHKKEPFLGFQSLKSNTVYTPNQFFDVCLPHSSLGVVRLVGYMLRNTIGWCDRYGNPLREQLSFSYNELIEKVGISRGSIRSALNDAIKNNFVRCVKTGRSKSQGDSGASAIYEIKWDSSNEYIKNLKQFKGFYNFNETYRTPVPNQFFDDILPHESLSVIKVVGTVTRLTIGFTNGRGDRRFETFLSYTEIQIRAQVKNRNDLSKAIKNSIESNYIVRLEQGFFDPRAGKKSKAATYSLRWLDIMGYGNIGTKNVPEKFKGDRYKKRTGIGTKNVPENRYKKRTIEMTSLNNISKQQPADVKITSFQKLIQEGFNKIIAKKLSSIRTSEEIENQITWLPYRSPNKNKMGMLRKAIEENWPAPAKLATSQVFAHGETFAKYAYAEYGRNPGEPTAQPTNNDIAAADYYTRRLLEIWPDLNQIQKWGRAFGMFVYTQHHNNQQKSKSIFFSVEHALRTYGDAFFVSTKRERERKLKEVESNQRTQYEAEHKQAWFSYLHQMQDKIKKQQPSEYAQFETWRKEKQQSLSVDLKRLGLSQRTDFFENPEMFLASLQDFFKKEVLDFWAWDEKINRQTVGVK